MKTTRLLKIAAVGASTAAAALGLIGVPGTSAVEVAGVTDLVVSVDAVQDVIAPPGTYAAFDVNVALLNGTGLPADITENGAVQVTLPAGSDVDDDLSTGCVEAGAPNVASCAIDPAVAPQVVATTPHVPGDYTATATITVAGVGLEISDSDSFTVQALSQGIAAGIVRTGGQLTLSLPDGRVYTLTVPDFIGEGKEGVIAQIEGYDRPITQTCPQARPGQCGAKGFLITFVQDYAKFTATDDDNPLESWSTFGTSDPCRSQVGVPADCAHIGFAKTPLSPVITLKAPCTQGSDGGWNTNGDGLPCSVGIVKVGASYEYSGRLLSDDPVEIPIGRLL
jgi:hypothetical protein